jgi:hypothetical protein
VLTGKRRNSLAEYPKIGVAKMKDLSLVRKQVKKSAYAAIAKVEDRHAFDFKLEGRRCRYIHKHDGGFTITDVPEWLYSDLERLCNEIRRFEKRTKLLLLKKRGVQTFLYKLFRSKAEINKALRHVSVSVPLAD